MLGGACQPSPRGVASDATVAASGSTERETPRAITSVTEQLRAAANAEPAAPAAAAASPAPLDAAEPLAPLEVPGFRPAVVALPRGATTRLPVLVALHGNFDRPEWQCENWQWLVRDRAFVLCPRGVPRTDAPRSWDRWTWGALGDVDREITVALAALAEAYPLHVDVERPVFLGFSLGGILGRFLAQKAPGRFPRLVLIEGGYESWPAPVVKRWAEAGGSRVLFACGQGDCLARSRQAARGFVGSGAEARVADGVGEGHSYGGKIAEAVRREVDWLVEGDPRWVFGPDR